MSKKKPSAGAAALVYGIWGRDRVLCDDPDCPLEHHTAPHVLGRYHYEDHPREGRPGVIVGADGTRIVHVHEDVRQSEGVERHRAGFLIRREPDWSCISVLLDNGTLVHVDAADLEVQ